MFFHFAIPGFHAAVHQAAVAALRGRPVAVAVDAGEQAPLFATSREARAAGVWPGLRAAAARRRCPGLSVVTPEPEWYRRAQARLVELCNAYTPCVGGRAGHLDGDLAGTERLWGARIGHPDRPLAQAEAIAGALRAAAVKPLGFDACVGVSPRLIAARLAARIAASGGPRVVAIAAADERARLDPLPLAWLGADGEAVARLADCGVATLGDARALGPQHLRELCGDGADAIVAALTGEDEPVVPELVDPEPELSAVRRCGDAGADPAAAVRLVGALARELGFALRTRGLACTVLTFAGRHLDGRTGSGVHRARLQLRHDDELTALACTLVARQTRRVHWERLTLTVSGLCSAEDQQELFAPQRGHRLERARDALRQRFGAEQVRPAADDAALPRAG